MDTFILNNEKEFRDYIISFSNEIMKIIIFEDSLDNITYFYCFTKKLILATKDILKPFSYYKEIYSKLKNDLKFKTDISNNDKTLKLIK